MNLLKPTRAFLLSLALTGLAFADLPQDLAKVAAAEGDLDGNALRSIEGQVATSFRDAAQRAAAEKSLLAALEAAKSPDAKIFLCHQLVFVASPASIAKLESLLIDERISHAARYTLAKIASPESAAALHRALSKSTGKRQAGLVNTLGRLRYRPATADIARLFTSSDPLVANAAVSALGQIATNESIEALTSARDAAPAELKGRIDDALLEAADTQLPGNKLGALLIYEAAYKPDRTRAVRIAALRGFVAFAGDVTWGFLVDAIKSGDADLAAAAISFTSSVQREDLSKLLADVFKSAPPAQQEQLVRALAVRNDATARDAVIAALQDDDLRVRVAALESLGSIGDASSVRLLAPALAKSTDERDAARVSLLRLKGDAVDATIRQTFSDDAKVRAELLRALVGRKAATSQELLAETNHADAAVRREAIAGLGALGREADLPPLVALIVKPKDQGDRTSIEDAVATILRRLNNAEKASSLVNDFLAKAGPEGKPFVLRLLRGAPSAQSLDAVRAHLKSDDKAIQESAIRTLADWPDAAAAPDLERLAQSAPTQPLKILSLRGYIRLADQSREPLPMYTRALELAQRPDERRLVLAGLAKVESLPALTLARNVLSSDAALVNEAANAVNQIAEKVRNRNPEQAKAALQAVVEKAKDQRLARRAQELIKEIDDRPRRR